MGTNFALLKPYTTANYERSQNSTKLNPNVFLDPRIFVSLVITTSLYKRKTKFASIKPWKTAKF